MELGIKKQIQSKSILPFVAFLWLLGGFLYSQINAQNNPIAIDHITIDQGLSQSTVNAVIQDQRGFMWFGTQDGLNKYDGYNFKIYKHDFSDTQSINNNYILDAQIDHAGRTWIGTADGLALFDPDQETFVRFYHQSGNIQSLSNNYIRSLCEDHRGNLWIGTADGLNVFVSEQYNFLRVPLKFEVNNDRNILSLMMDHAGALWVGLNDGNVLQLNISDINHVVVINHYNAWNAAKRVVTNNIWTIYEDRSRQIWFGTELGLFQYNPSKNQWTHYIHDDNNTYSLISNSVRQIHEDRFGALWIGTNHGLDQLDRVTGRFKHYTTSSLGYSAARNDRIRCLFEDNTGRLWIGTDGEGIIKLDRNKFKFHHTRQSANNPNSLNHNMVLSVTEDRVGNLWIGTLGGGLNKYNRESDRWTQYQNIPANSKSLSDNNVRALAVDSSDKLWIGTLQGGLNYFDPTNGVFKRYSYRTGDPNGLSNNAVTTLWIDRTGILWIGTYNGLNQFDSKTKRFIQYVHDDKDSFSLSHNQIRALYEDNRGTLWIGTFGGGLNKLDKSANHFFVYNHRPDDSTSLSSNIIRSIHVDRKGRMWIGTDHGLNLMNPDNGRCIRYSEKDHLPNDVIYAILEDTAGNIWISTNNGLSEFNPDSLLSVSRNRPHHGAVFRNYTVSDGLQSLEFNQSACFQSRNGEMFFGGINGLNHFFPDRIRDNSYIPPVVMTGFKIFNEPAMLTGDISSLDHIELSYEENFFTIEFAALDYTDPDRNQYAYKMEGFDKDWIYIGTRRFAGYTNLSGGQYVFRVKGSNNDGVWNETGTGLTIVIKPPWWEQWWFRVLAVLCLVSMTYLFIHLRMRVMRNQNRQLEILVTQRTDTLRDYSKRLETANIELLKLNEKKNEFLGIAAHDIRNPLSAIINFTKIILRDMQSAVFNKEEAKADLLNILKAAEQTIHLVSALLDISAIESGKVNMDLHQVNMAMILEECEHRHRKHALQKKIRFDVEKRYDLPMVKVDHTRITEVLDNLLSNALKYTYPGGSIKVYCDRNPGELVTHVRDNGQGLNDRDLQEIFRSYKKLSARPTGGETSTGLGLAIVKKIVELHGGKVWVDSQYGMGSTFSFSLPVNE
jgi:two-component system, sensor histidine kinase ChiS